MALPIPQTVGNYRIIAKLGQGGMARALLAMRQGRAGFRKLFVIKQLRPDLLEETEFVDMFFDEARLAALLSHPNVVQTHEILEEEGEFAIAMEYLEGQPLSRLHRRLGPEGFPLRLHVYILTEVLAGLHYAHNLTDLSGDPLNVVHRDISPGNVFVTYDGQVKLLDFGIAKAAGANAQTKVGGIKGKLHYMAPEQAKAEKIDHRADMFAVGVLLWEAVAERRLVKRGEATAVTLNNRVNGYWPDLHELNPDAPPELVEACRRAMELEPVDRFADADEFRRALLSWLERTETSPSREQVADLITSHFARDRAVLADKIAAKIEEDAPGSDELLSRTALTSVSMAGARPVRSGTEPTLDRAKPRGRLSFVVAGAGLLALIGGISLAYVISRGAESTDDAHANTAVVPAAAGDRANQPVRTVALNTGPDKDSETIELFVSAAPNAAIIELDGETMAGNPYQEQVPRDGEMHELVISAAGHEPSTRMVRFNSDIHIELSLNKAASDSPVVGERSEADRAKARDRARARRAKALAQARAKAAAEAKAEAEARAKAEAEAEAKAKAAAAAKAKKDQSPKAGDVLTRDKKKDNSRKIDEENPYE